MERPAYTTKKLLKALKKKHDNCTNYRIHKILRVAESTVGNWDKRGYSMSNEIGRKVAAELGLDEDKVITSLQWERDKDTEMAPVWMHIYNRLDAVAATVIMSVFVLPPF